MATFETFPERMNFETVLAAAEMVGEVPAIPKADWQLEDSANHED